MKLRETGAPSRCCAASGAARMTSFHFEWAEFVLPLAGKPHHAATARPFRDVCGQQEIVLRIENNEKTEACVLLRFVYPLFENNNRLSFCGGFILSWCLQYWTAKQRRKGRLHERIL